MILAIMLLTYGNITDMYNIHMVLGWRGETMDGLNWMMHGHWLTLNITWNTRTYIIKKPNKLCP